MGCLAGGAWGPGLWLGCSCSPASPYLLSSGHSASCSLLPLGQRGWKGWTAVRKDVDVPSHGLAAAAPWPVPLPKRLCTLRACVLAKTDSPVPRVGQGSTSQGFTPGMLG